MSSGRLHLDQVVVAELYTHEDPKHMAVSLKSVPKMGCPGKWKHGLTSAVPWVLLILTHTHMHTHGFPTSCTNVDTCELPGVYGNTTIRVAAAESGVTGIPSGSVRSPLNESRMEPLRTSANAQAHPFRSKKSIT